MMKFSNKSSEVKFMSSLAEASHRLHKLAEPAPVGDSVKAAMRRAGRAMDAWCKANGVPQWTNNRIRDLWNADRRVSVSADEMEQLRAAEAARKKSDEDARTEVRQILDGIASMVARLASIDPEFHSEAIAALGRQAPQDQRQAGRAERDGCALD